MSSRSRAAALVAGALISAAPCIRCRALDASVESALLDLPGYKAEQVEFPRGAAYLTADGAIRIVGYNDMKGIFEALDALFISAHPRFRFSLALTGTKAAASALTRGESGFAPMGAEFYESDVSVFQKSLGSYPLEIAVAHDSLDPRALSSPMAIYVPRDNPLEKLATDQVARIFTVGSAKGLISTWGELGLGGEWSKLPIHAYGLGLNTALGYFMQKHHFFGRPFRSDFVAIYRSQDVVAQVGRDPLAIGFSILNNITPEVKVIGIVPRIGSAELRGSAANLISGAYPYDRHLLVYLRQPLEPWIREYMRLFLSREGQRAVAMDSRGYLPLNRREAAANLAAVER